MKQKYTTRKEQREIHFNNFVLSILVFLFLLFFSLVLYHNIFIVPLQQQFQLQGEINDKTIEGLSLRGFDQSEVEEITNEHDAQGDWVCVNVRGMSFKRAIEVCHHEVGHEIFAEICEKNITKCFEAIE